MESIISKILTRGAKTIQATTTIYTCTHCKKEIDPNHIYVHFTGEYLHNDCLIEYLQKMRILKIINPQSEDNI